MNSRLRHLRQAIGRTCATAGCKAGMAANGASTTQSMRASGRAAAMSLIAGVACTTSPIDEVLTMRIRT